MTRSVAAPGIGLVQPDLGRPSGGSVYNAELARAWPAGQPELTVLTASSLRENPAVLQRFSVTIVDGLLGSADPDALERARSHGARIVLLVHMASPAEGGLTSAERAHRAGLERRAIDAAWRVVTPSRWAAADLRKRYGPRRIAIARPGAHTAPVAPAHDPPRLLQLGTIGPLKNQHLAVAAASRCADLDFRLRIAGPVADDAYADRLARTASGSPVEIRPAVDDVARESLYGDTDLLVSLAHHESWGLTVTEALAHGIPAIVGRDTGGEEALGAAGTPLPGTAVSTTDLGEIESVLRCWLTDRDRRRQWRGRAIAARERLPRWDQTARVLADVCSEATGPVTTT